MPGFGVNRDSYESDASRLSPIVNDLDRVVTAIIDASGLRERAEADKKVLREYMRRKYDITQEVIKAAVLGMRHERKQHPSRR